MVRSFFVSFLRTPSNVTMTPLKASGCPVPLDVPPPRRPRGLSGQDRGEDEKKTQLGIHSFARVQPQLRSEVFHHSPKL